MSENQDMEFATKTLLPQHCGRISEEVSRLLAVKFKAAALETAVDDCHCVTENGGIGQKVTGQLADWSTSELDNWRIGQLADTNYVDCGHKVMY